MCKSANNSIEELEDLFKYDEMNTITNIDEINIEKYMTSLSSLVTEHIKNETEIENTRIVVDKLKRKFPNYLQKCTNKHKCQYKKTTLLFYYKKFVLLEKIKQDKFLELMLMKSPSRDISGINQITILT